VDCFNYIVSKLFNFKKKANEKDSDKFKLEIIIQNETTDQDQQLN